MHVFLLSATLSDPTDAVGSDVAIELWNNSFAMFGFTYI